ncbi:MAG: hypothetical protein WC622_02705 [Pedobacter sp.]|jgi:hypothetical protein|uniref:hypothetical protein n=1 Tax=Pedobacter sp. TaxID=1411316 RepID=UPI0035623159
MSRNILLIEPNFKNKYPPIGLMKISTYHKMLGDNVQFYKGDLKAFELRIRLSYTIEVLQNVLPEFNWFDIEKEIKAYISSKRLKLLDHIVERFEDNLDLIRSTLKSCATDKLNHTFDRIYVSTLFTFYWDITIKTIEFTKTLTGNLQNIFIGGVMASLLTKEIIEETGITPITGLLDKPNALDNNCDIIIDELPLDYSILHEIEYVYPTESAYFTFMTKGCTRKCAFCSVPKLEPTYKEKIDAKNPFEYVRNMFGEQRNLLLMDNNVLASPKFPEIIQEIKDLGFYKGATFTYPNMLKIAIDNLITGYNDKVYIKEAYNLIHGLTSRIKSKSKTEYEQLLKDSNLLQLPSEKNILINAFPLINVYFEKYRYQGKLARYVDFNQGVDARYVTEENMKLMSEIPIRPLRLAFDHIGIKKTYINAVELAAKYGLTDLSNYILFNFKDKPADFYERLKINVDLGKRLNIKIFSFPMKFVPLFGEEAKSRKHVGQHWNKKFLRAIQTILIATRGIVAPGYEFFEMAYGKDLKSFMDLLYMPESYIINRNYFKNNGMIAAWKNDFQSLTVYDQAIARKLIEENEFSDIESITQNSMILRLLSHYKFDNDKKIVDVEVNKLRSYFDKLIKHDMFIDLTLTHDFEISMKEFKSA